MSLDSIFDRLGDMLRASLNDDGDSTAPRTDQARRGRKFADPDMDAAWNELNDYLNEGHDFGNGPDPAAGDERERRAGPGQAGSAHSTGRQGQGAGGSRTGSAGRASSGTGRTFAANGLPEELRQDYTNLGVPFGAPMEKVKSAYKKLLMQYHPDKNADNPEKLRIATEITQKINISYQRIEKYHDTGRF